MTDNHLLLYRLAELMFEHEQHILPVDLLFDDEQIGDFAKSIQIDSPYQQMIFEGVLTETVREEKLFVSFTVEGYFHFVLGEVIYNRTQGLGAEVLKQIIEENKLNGVKEGLEQCLIRDVHKDDLTRLMWLISHGGEALEVCSVPLAQAFFGIKLKSNKDLNFDKRNKNQILRVINKVLQDSSGNYVFILQSAIDYLEVIQKTAVLKILNKIVIDKIAISNIGIANFKLKRLTYLTPKETKKVLNSITSLQFRNSNPNETMEYHLLCGRVYDFIGRYDLAIEEYKKSISCLKGKSDNFRLGIINNYFGNAYRSQGDTVKAEKYFQNSLKCDIENYGDFDTSTSTSLNNLGISACDNGNFDLALDYFNKCLNIRHDFYGRYHPETAQIYNNLGGVYFELEEIDKAIELNILSLEIEIKLFGAHSIGAIGTRYNLALLYKSQGFLDNARKLVDINLAGLIINKLGNHELLYLNYILKGDLCFQLNEFKEAINCYLTVVNKCIDFIGAKHDVLIDVNIALGNCYKELAQYTESLSYFHIALKKSSEIPRKNNKLFNDIYYEISCACYSSGNYAMAIDSIKNILDYDRNIYALNLLGNCYFLINELEKSLEAHISAVKVAYHSSVMELPVSINSIQNSLELSKKLNKLQNLPSWILDYYDL